MRRKATTGDAAFNTLLYVILILMAVITLYPFLNSLAISLNDADDTTRGGLSVYPRVFSTRNYELIFQNKDIYTAYFITISRTVVGTLTALFCTGLFAFGLAHSNLKGRRLYTMLCVITMYFGGGLIPYYFLIKWLGMVDSFNVYWVPGLVGVFNMILMRTYFQGIPLALEESARIDGANYWTVFFRIILPISTPIIATIALFVGVGQWNSWFDASIFITKNTYLKPMQNVLLSIISQARFAEQLAQLGSTTGVTVDASNVGHNAKVNVRSITMATMIITILPIVMAYPFLQRYFIKGIMVGSLKG